MKAQVQSCKNARVGSVREGKVHKINQREKEDENVEIKKYLHQLQELVPFMPKSKRLSKLEVISNVIDYIHDLRETLGLPACSATFDMEIPMTSNQNSSHVTIASSSVSHCAPALLSASIPNHHQYHRQPFCVFSNPRTH